MFSKGASGMNAAGASAEGASAKGHSAAGKKSRRRGPDFALALMRLVFLAAALALALAFALPGPGAEAPPNWHLRAAIGAAGFLAALLAAFSLRKAFEWERAIVLRLGRFHRARGPGLYFLAPLLDHVCKTIDIRARALELCAAETLTGDSVAAAVDALCLWKALDPQKAALEAEDCEAALELCAKAALRSAVSKNSLADLLARGGLIERQAQQEAEKQAAEWGISVQRIQITGIRVPGELHGPLLQMAQAESAAKAAPEPSPAPARPAQPSEPSLAPAKPAQPAEAEKAPAAKAAPAREPSPELVKAARPKPAPRGVAVTKAELAKVLSAAKKR